MHVKRTVNFNMHDDEYNIVYEKAKKILLSSKKTPFHKATMLQISMAVEAVIDAECIYDDDKQRTAEVIMKLKNEVANEWQNKRLNNFWR